ncbi:MAG: tyrosine-type recombinase/integrase [Elusimicrobiota bacterium]|jgi:integrase
MGKKVIAGQYEVDFTYKGQRIRGTIPCETLVALITGVQAGQAMANLGGQGVIVFSKFVDEFYLPRHAKPNKKPSAYASDAWSSVCLKKFFGEKPVHLITRTMREEFKQQRLSGKLSAKTRPCANNTVNRELSCLNQIMEYAQEMGFLQENPLDGMKRLPTGHREQYWLTREQLDTLLEAAKTYEGGRYLEFLEFVTYTGARLNEALAFKRGDIDYARQEIRLPTLKKRKRRNAERFLSIKSIGPRLEGVLQRLKPHSASGYYFATRSGTPLQGRYVDEMFAILRRKVGLDKFHIHDLRHTFAMHRAMTRITFRQLQVELGHSSPQSVQAYLDQAERFDPEQSIFY